MSRLGYGVCLPRLCAHPAAVATTKSFVSEECGELHRKRLHAGILRTPRSNRKARCNSGGEDMFPRKSKYQYLRTLVPKTIP